MKRSLFISLILCQFLWGCLPGDGETAATKPRATKQVSSTSPAAAAGDYLWISLRYFMGQLGSSLEFSVLPYDPLTYPTPDPSLSPGRQDGWLPHARFRSETGEIVTDIPLTMVIHQDYLLIDGGLWIEWEAFVPDISEYECVELLSQSELAITKLEIQPPLRMC
jgi:hypothetical protein